MKQILHSLIFILFCGNAVSQQAYQAPGVFRRDQAAADLSSQTPFILGNQNPADFTLTFHASMADAQANVAAIPGVINFSGIQIIQVFARVTENATNDFAISSFKVVWDLQTLAPYFPEIIACMSAQLPWTELGAFYSEPMGGGFQYMPGQTITGGEFPNGMAYWFAGNADCYIETSFFVLIDYPPFLETSALLSCIGDETFDLTQATWWPSTFYHSAEDAWNYANPIENPTNYPGADGEVVWVNMQSYACMDIQPLTLGFEACTPNTISGTVRLSQNGVDCTEANPGLAGCALKRTTSSQTVYAFTNDSGDYMFNNVSEGSNTITPDPFESYMSVLDPTSATINVQTSNQYERDFCVQENPYNDVRVILYSLSSFRPAITTQLMLRIINDGNTAASGTVAFGYDNFEVDFVSATVAPVSSVPGTLTFNYSIAAHQGQNIVLSFYTPTTTVMGDVLTFSANATFTDDENLNNNLAVTNEVVVNSYDPNDITIVEGPTISMVDAEGYLHYVVRFQNTGTAEAFNVRIENALSDMFDASTFRPLYASHTYFTERSGNNVTFSFPDIGLPAEQDDEPASHGYVVYEVKPAAGFEVGDVFDAQASIFFDTNPAIVTNVASTVITQLSVADNDNMFTIYPNPAGDTVTIKSNNPDVMQIEITDARGATVFSNRISPEAAQTSIDVSTFSAGLYFVKIASKSGSSTRKLIVK